MNRSGEDWREAEAGQATLTLVLVLGIFLVGVLGFAADFANLWFRQQKAQTAADAACQAGAMDMLGISQLTDTTGAPPSGAGFTPGTGFDCASTPAASPCQYAALNGFTATAGGLATGRDSNKIQVEFPTSVPNVTTPPAALTAHPFMRVDVTDRIRVYFSSLLSGAKTQDVIATAKCGLVLAPSPIPIVVLDPTDPNTILLNGTPNITIAGGPIKSIQVNSNNATAISSGGSINLSAAGPSGTGGILGVTGGPSTATSNFISGTPTASFWNSPAAPVSDPFALLATPAQPAVPTTPNPVPVAYHVNGCPDNGGCDEYKPGYYPAGISVGKPGADTAIFDPGLYYLDGNLSLRANSTVRPSLIGGINNSGTMFYFHGSNTFSVAANSGKQSVDSLPVTQLQCPGGAAVTVPGGATQLNGNILVGMCSGTYGDPLGQNRGMLFFQDRSVQVSASWGGGGQFALVGNMYFHQCNAAGTGTGCNAPPAGFQDSFDFGGNAGSGTYVLGDIITDQLSMHGTPAITMQLTATASYSVLKVQLLQ